MLKIVVLYESLFGNTEKVAKAIADGLALNGEVTLATFSAAPAKIAEADLIVLGGPTHGWGLTKPSSRTQPGTQGYSLGAREWLERAPQGNGKKAAAFDTRFDKPRWLTGSAAGRIGKELANLGYQMPTAPESFFVLHTRGPLREGEEQRAKRWGANLADTALASLDQTM